MPFLHRENGNPGLPLKPSSQFKSNICFFKLIVITATVIVINLRIGMYRIDEGIESATKKDGSSESTTMIKTYKYDALLTIDK